MAGKISDLTSNPSVDRTTDLMEMVHSGASYKATPNLMLGFSGGNPVSTSDTQNLTNKTLDNTNTITLKATLFTLQDSSDTTKQARFVLSSITTGTTRSYTLPDVSDTVVTLGATQTLTSKTLTSPTINTPTISNATITADAYSGFSVANTGTIYGIAVTTGVITTSNSVNPAALVTGIQASKFSIPYKFRVYRNAAANTGNGAFAVVAFDTKTYDTGTNVSAGVFTAPVAGFYRFSWHVLINNAGASQLMVASLFKNGTQNSDGSQLTTSSVAFASVGTDEVQCAINDTIDIRAYSTATQPLTVASIYSTYFSGSLMSVT